MSIENYQLLIDRICEQCGIPDPASMYSSADLQIGGVNFSLFYGGVIAPDSVIIYSDFGELPVNAREAVLLRLLETNMYLFGTNSPTFTFNSENMHVLLASRVPLGNATAEKMIALLSHYAGLAREWRNTYFLLDEEAETGSLAKSSPQARHDTAKRLSAQMNRVDTREANRQS